MGLTLFETVIYVLTNYSQDDCSLAFQFAVPIKIIAPAFMEVIRGKCPAVVLKFPTGRLKGCHAGEHVALTRQTRALLQVAHPTGRDNIFPDRAPTTATGNNVVEG